MIVIPENDEQFLDYFEEHLYNLDDFSLEFLWNDWNGEDCPFEAIVDELEEFYFSSETPEEKNKFVCKIFRLFHMVLNSASYAPAAYYYQKFGDKELEYAMSGIMDKVRMAKVKESLK